MSPTASFASRRPSTSGDRCVEKSPRRSRSAADVLPSRSDHFVDNSDELSGYVTSAVPGPAGAAATLASGSEGAVRLC